MVQLSIIAYNSNNIQILGKIVGNTENTAEGTTYGYATIGHYTDGKDAASVRKELVLRLAKENFGKSGRTREVLRSIYGTDYKRINIKDFVKRLRLMGQVIDAIDRNSEYKSLEDEVLHQLKKRLDQVQDRLLGNFVLRDGVAKIEAGEKSETVGKLNPKLSKLIAMTRRRVITRKKMIDLVRRDIAFTDWDYRQIASDFDVPVEDAKELIAMFKSCFDKQGHFLRSVFEKHIPIFVWYEKRIFDFMWNCLKGTLRRNDRVAFLNSFQLLIDRMNTPKKVAIKTLLTDFLSDPYAVDFSDRNALMLANLLVRKYNKELQLDIEVTPEEVLLVRDGVDEDLALALAESLDNIHRGRLLKKIRSIHRRLAEALDPKRSGTPSMPVRYLLSLERETFIFLCLVGGETAASVVRSALKKYGNPKSDIYRMELSGRYLIPLLNHLKLVVRAVGRFGTADDLQQLSNVSWWEEGFRQLAMNEKQVVRVMQVMKWIDSTRERIVQKDFKDSRDTVGFRIG